jgi:hypothetical protein
MEHHKNLIKGNAMFKLLDKKQKFAEMMRLRHRNPLSGWSRVVLTVPLIHSIWLHDFVYMAIVAVLVVTNPFWFKPLNIKKTDNLNFMTHVVDGEWLFMKDKARLTKKFYFLSCTLFCQHIGYTYCG